MKFGAQLELYAVPEWREAYIRYNVLKRFLVQRRDELRASWDYVVSEKDSICRASLGGAELPFNGEEGTRWRRPRENVSHGVAISPRVLCQPLLHVSDESEASVGANVVTPEMRVNQEFCAMLDSELEKVQRHFSRHMELLGDQLLGVQEELSVLEEETKKEIAEQEEKSSLELRRQGATDSNDESSAVESQTDRDGRAAVSCAVARKPCSSLNCQSASMRSQQKPGSASVISRVVYHLYPHGKREGEERKDLVVNAKMRAAHKQRLARTVVNMWKSVDRLEEYVQLNIVALYKILKKRDKVLGMHCLQADLQEKKRRLSLLVVSQFIKDSLLRIYNECAEDGEPHEFGGTNQGSAPNTNAAAAHELQTLSLLVQKHFTATRSLSVVNTLGEFQKSAMEYWIFFALGVCFMAVIDIAFAISAQATEPLFSLDVILVYLPLFRVSLIASCVLWGMALATAVLERYGVNYRFLLNVDPKCRIGSRTLFGVASLFTCAWVLGFGGFVFDSKFGLFLDPSGSVYGEAWARVPVCMLIFLCGCLRAMVSRYFAYPLVVILLQAAVCCLPSRTFCYSYRLDLLSVLFGTFKSGFWCTEKVTLVHNIVGDTWTSLPKTFVDMAYTLFYYLGFWFLGDPLNFLEVSGNWEKWAAPIITLIPYWIRFNQCFFRLCTENGMRQLHAANMGKYLSTMLVILSSSMISWESFGLSIYASRLIFVFTYLFASMYNLIWDVMIDWGLLADPDYFARPNRRVLYPQWVYYAISIFNLFGRLTWALTLVPIEIINNQRFNASIIVYVISTLEIFRRSAWIILRLENEHLTNSSRYRAMLWVPKLSPCYGLSDEPGGGLSAERDEAVGDRDQRCFVRGHSYARYGGCRTSIFGGKRLSKGLGTEKTLLGQMSPKSRRLVRALSAHPTKNGSGSFSRRSARRKDFCSLKSGRRLRSDPNLPVTYCDTSRSASPLLRGAETEVGGFSSQQSVPRDWGKKTSPNGVSLVIAD